jgi:hypothetical protein
MPFEFSHKNKRTSLLVLFAKKSESGFIVLKKLACVCETTLFKAMAIVGYSKTKRMVTAK